MLVRHSFRPRRGKNQAVTGVFLGLPGEHFRVPRCRLRSEIERSEENKDVRRARARYQYKAIRRLGAYKHDRQRRIRSVILQALPRPCGSRRAGDRQDLSLGLQPFRAGGFRQDHFMAR
jgi:hypothetical protein